LGNHVSRLQGLDALLGRLNNFGPAKQIEAHEILPTAFLRRGSKLNFLNFGKKTSQRETLSRSAQETARL
jgi:hypothetical protein